MDNVTDHPALVFVISFGALWTSAWLGAAVFRGRGDPHLHEDFGIVLAATLTLLGLIIGFSFSMAINRYDQRKSFEAAEANAIGTEYVRADLLPAATASRTRGLLDAYLRQRIAFYVIRDEQQRRQNNLATARLQKDLWSTVVEPSIAQPTPMLALAVSGMNDVLNSQAYTQAAWWNRIPTSAWLLMLLIAICCNVMIGFGTRRLKADSILLVVLPFVVAVACFLIADIDTPRGGIIHVEPQNLKSLFASLHGP